MRPRLTIITVHKGPLVELKKTIDSVYQRLDLHTEHIVVARIHGTEICAIRDLCERSKLIVNQDRSLYDAMNIGLRNSSGVFVNFINSGDELCATIPSSELTEVTCHIFRSTLAVDGKLHVSRAHAVNHQNFLAPNDNLIRFEEEYQIFADAHWMNRLLAKYGAKRCPQLYATFHYGGLSTHPTLLQGLKNMRLDQFLTARFKLLIKALFISVGLERINKYMLLKGYR